MTTPCDLCPADASRVFLCEHHWQQMPADLREAWQRVAGQGRNGGPAGDKLDVIRRIQHWTKQQHYETPSRRRWPAAS